MSEREWLLIVWVVVGPVWWFLHWYLRKSLGMPAWAPDEAYIVRLRRWLRTR
jgi:hypothetical protein